MVSVLTTSINVLSKSKSKNYVTWIANLTKLFLSVYVHKYINSKCIGIWKYNQVCLLCILRNELKVHSYFHIMSKLLNCNYYPKMQMYENQKSIFYHICQSESQIPNFMERILTTLQMFTGIYRVFTGKSKCGDFKFVRIAYVYLQSPQKL